MFEYGPNWTSNECVDIKRLTIERGEVERRPDEVSAPCQCANTGTALTTVAYEGGSNG